MNDALLDDLNHEQREAVIHADGPLLIVAGAGTGKTTVVTRRIAWLIREGRAKGDEILGLTFTDKAAGETEERVDRLLPMGYTDLWLSTFHAFGERLLRAHAIDIGLPNEFKLLNTTAQWLLMRRHFEKFDLDYYRPLGNPTKFIHALLKHFSRAKDEGVSADEYLDYVEGLKADTDVGESTGGAVIKKKFKGNSRSKVQNNEIETSEMNIRESDAGRLEEIAKAYKTYEQLLLEEGALDFGDLIMYALKILKSRPHILTRYRNQFKYILVDEFQDTNWAQYELVKLLSPPRHNLTVVADDDQSIYRFRGAAMSNIIQFEHDYQEATFIVLTENYRSRQEILDLSYQFIQKNNPNRLESRNVRVSNATQSSLKARGGIVKELKAKRPGTATISLSATKTAEEEIGVVIEKILEIKNGKTLRPSFVSDQADNIQSGHDGVSWNDFAILVRANSQADAYVHALSQHGIPCQYVASKGLYSKPLILDIVAWLKLLDNYHESPSMWRVLVSSPIAMPWNDLTELTSFAHKKSLSLYEALKLSSAIAGISDEGKGVAARVLSLIESETHASRTLSVGKVVLQILEHSGYLKYLSLLVESEAKAQFSNINQWYKSIILFEQSVPDASVRAFLEAHQMTIESGDEGAFEINPDEGPEAVKVMTVHAAKGLEFHTVFVVQMVDKRFPSIERSDPIELPYALMKEVIPEGDIHLEEERRLLYVAMTRARTHLFFTRAEDYGGVRKKKPSVFLHELGLAEEGAVKGGVKEKKEPLTSYTHMTYRPDTIDRIDTPYRIPDRFSFTQLKAFETCPYQYRFAHILKVPVKGRATFSFGKTMHATLQQFFELIKERKGNQQELFAETSLHPPLVKEGTVVKLPSIETLLDLYKKNWIDDWYDSKQDKERYFRQGKDILEKFYENIKENPPATLYLEQGFHLKIGVGAIHESPVQGESGELVTIKGVIDRIDGIEGGVEVIDYKTGNTKEMDARVKEQLLIYQIAATEVLGLKPLKLTYYYLNDQKKVSFLGTEMEINTMKKKIIETIMKIKVSKFQATPSPHVCKFCDYKEICEYRKL